MQHDEFYNFIINIQQSMPQYRKVLDATLEAYTITQAQKSQIDYHYVMPHPPGHYYSPLPSRAEVAAVASRVFFGSVPDTIPGVDLREREQLKLYTTLLPLYKEMPFTDEKQPGYRYYFHNDFYCYADAYFLYALMRELRPQRIVEVGSGFSSAVMLDTNEHFLQRQASLTFIEPNPERLHAQIRPTDASQVTIIQDFVQNVPMEVFTNLQKNDILFIDSSHVGKIGSDVLYELFTILPLLQEGVVIHFHDIFYPFEYPRTWLEQEGRAWNEAYFLRAFLQYNETFEIILFNHYLGTKHGNMLSKNTPLCAENTGGSLWLRKTFSRR